MAKSPHMLATERAGLAESAGALRAAGVVGGRTLAALDAIIPACRAAGPGRAARVRDPPGPPSPIRCGLAGRHTPGHLR